MKEIALNIALTSAVTFLILIFIAKSALFEGNEKIESAGGLSVIITILVMAASLIAFIWL